MRVVIFFDLPVITLQQRRIYIKFRKMLIREGFIMMQESVYSKLALNSTAIDLIKNKLKKNKPKEGLVQMLTVTEKQFSSIELVVGEISQKIIDSTNRLTIL